MYNLQFTEDLLNKMQSCTTKVAASCLLVLYGMTEALVFFKISVIISGHY